jgi:hypothetical protein
MSLPFGLSGKTIAQQTISDLIRLTLVGLLTVVALWAYGFVRGDSWPSSWTVLLYVLAFQAGAVLIHLVRWRQTPNIQQIRNTLRATPVAETQAPLAPPPKFSVSSEAVNVPLSSLDRSYWDGFPNREFVTPYLVTITLRPELKQSLSGGTLRLEPKGQLGGFSTIAKSDSAGFRPFAWRTEQVINGSLPTLIPGDSADVKLIVLVAFQLQPEFRWFLLTASGEEVDAGNYSYKDYVLQRY